VSKPFARKTAPKTSPGNFFEDFRLGQEIRHAIPRTITDGDVALYNGLFGARFAVAGISPAQQAGFATLPGIVSDMAILLFFFVFKS